VLIETSFPNVIRRLLARYSGESFDLGLTVHPVTIVDTDISLSAISNTAPLNIPATEGDKAAPAADTLLADTGALDEGTWDITIGLFANEANSFLIQRRNAANTANVWQFRYRWSDSGRPFPLQNLRVVVNQDERIRVVNEGIAAGGTTYAAHIWSRQA